MRRVAILQQVLNQPRCQRVDDSVSCTGGLALKESSIRDVHRQERTALLGIRRRSCGGRVPVDAKEPGIDRHVHQ